MCSNFIAAMITEERPLYVQFIKNIHEAPISKHAADIRDRNV